MREVHIVAKSGNADANAGIQQGFRWREWRITRQAFLPYQYLFPSAAANRFSTYLRDDDR